MTALSFTHARWFSLLPKELQQLTVLSSELARREKRLQSSLYDYSFVLFPIAKAYEGFLKKYLLDNQLITKEVFMGRKFRIGRALNPDLPERQRDEWWLYDDVVRLCGAEEAREMWKVWIQCRNHVFHFFPNQTNHLRLEEAENKIHAVLQVMETLSYCTIPDHIHRPTVQERLYAN